MDFNHDTRIVNIRYIVAGLHFDAAIDCNWQLHCYSEWSEKSKSKVVPIELYCFDHTEWDIRMIYQEGDNSQFLGRPSIHHTICNFPDIIEETKKWIIEELGESVLKEIEDKEPNLFE